MRVLVACERSGRVRDAFRLFGHDAWSCDVLPSRVGGRHIEDDVCNVLSDGWDLCIAHPPCTYLTRLNLAGRRAHPDRVRSAIAFADKIRSAAAIQAICIENPIGSLWSEWGRPTQVIEPWMFGEPYTKRTGLWLKGLLPLQSELVVRAADSWTDVHHTSEIRSRTFWGVALAMAGQWGGDVAVGDAIVGKALWPRQMWIGFNRRLECG